MKPRERQLLDTIDAMTRKAGFPPTLREVATAMKLSLARIQQLADACQRQGWIQRHPRAARTMRVIRPAATT